MRRLFRRLCALPMAPLCLGRVAALDVIDIGVVFVVPRALLGLWRLSLRVVVVSFSRRVRFKDNRNDVVLLALLAVILVLGSRLAVIIVVVARLAVIIVPLARLAVIVVR